MATLEQKMEDVKIEEKGKKQQKKDKKKNDKSSEKSAPLEVKNIFTITHSNQRNQFCWCEYLC